MSRSRWIAPALWGALIELGTSWPRIPDLGQPEGSDKLVHITMYGVFSWLTIRAAQQGRPAMRAMLLTLAALTVWAALDEWHQKFIDGRSPSVADWVADTAGVAMGLALGWARPRQVSSRLA